jgi:protein-disulfide isomerase
VAEAVGDGLGQQGEPAAATDVRAKGDPDAPLTIVEYSDFQCPFCARWFEDTYPVLLEEYIETGKARLVFRDFPLSFHANADNAAVATRCAGEQDAYWPMHDRLFAAQAEWADLPDPSATYAAYAAELDLDGELFGECLASGKYDEAIQEDLRVGQAAGVSGTPSFLINGQLLVGAQPAQVFRMALDTVLAGGSIEEEPETQAQGAPEPIDSPIEGSPVKGDAEAPITIVTYSDYQCPYCARFAVDTMGSLLEEYVATGQAKIVFKDFPIEQIHPQAQQASEAARCVRELAGGDDAYWVMHDRLFAGQQEWANQDTASQMFAVYAADLGVDEADFSNCLESGQFTEAVQADLMEGVQLGVRGTPTFFINGQPFVGAQPLESFRQAIAIVAEGGSIVPPTPAPTPTPAPLTEDIPLEDAAGIKGDPAAPVIIVEYSDYQCPFCRRHNSETLSRLQPYIDDGTVLYVFKDFPLTSIHPQAPQAAEAARCAGEQDAYWEMHDRLFDGQEAWSGNPSAEAVFRQYAAELNLDQDAFQACLDSGRYQAVVQANLEEGLGYGVRGTPSFFVNRQILPGAYPIEAFQAMIEAELGR